MHSDLCVCTFLGTAEPVVAPEAFNKVLVGQGDEDGGWLLQDKVFQMRDLCNLWQQVGDQSGKPTDKPVLILVDTCYALRLGLR